MKNNIANFGYYQIVMGILAVLVFIYSLSSISFFSNIQVALVFLIISYLALNVYSGFLMIERKRMLKGLQLATILLLFQVFHIEIAGFKYSVVSGISLFLGVDLTESIQFYFNFGFSDIMVGITEDNQLIRLLVNPIPLFLLFFFSDSRVTRGLEQEGIGIENIK